MNPGHDPYAALRYRDYRLLLTGAVLANIGLEIQAVAAGWELYLRTESPWWLGWAGLVQFLPVLFFALIAGQVADTFNRKRLFQLALTVMGCASLGLAALSYYEGPEEIVLLFLFLSGTGRAFSIPARVSLMPQLIPSETLPNAVTWNSSGWQIANVAGPALGGLALALAPPVVSYLIAAAGTIACATLILPIRPGRFAYSKAWLQRLPQRRLPPLTITPRKPPATTQRLFSIPCPQIQTLRVKRPVVGRSLGDLLAGLRFVWSSKLLLAAITIDLFAVLLGGATALLPIFARDILNVGPTGLGWLRAAPALGAFVMALLLAHRPPLQRPGQALLLSVAVFGVTTIVFGFSESFVLSFVCLALAGAFDNISVVIRGTFMQVLTPDGMRGRVAAVNSVFVSSSNELGAFESGVTAAVFGPVASVVGGGIGTILVVLLAGFVWPELLRTGPPTPPEPPNREPRRA